MNRSWPVMGMLAIVGVAAIIHTVRGDENGSRSGAREGETKGTQSLTGPNVPAAGALPGKLIIAAGRDCRVRSIDLVEVELGRAGSETTCGLWVSPDGQSAVATLDGRKGAAGREIGLMRLDDPPKLVRKLGVAHGNVAWSPDGHQIAWCGEDGNTMVLMLSSDRREQVRGCHPDFTPDGSLLTSPDETPTRELLREGDVLLDERDLVRPFQRNDRGVISILGYDAGADGRLAATLLHLTGDSAEIVLEIWRGRQLERAVELGTRSRSPIREGTVRVGIGRLIPSRQLVRFSPDEHELVVALERRGARMTLVDLRSGSLISPPVDQYGFAWSPDGAWFTVSTEDEILIYGAVRSDPVYTLPVAGSALAWR